MENLEIELRDAGAKGRGVFTVYDIAKGTTIENAPVILLPFEEKKHIDKTGLMNYIFEWDAEPRKIAVALGWVSLYNHAVENNCAYSMDYENETISITAVRKIRAGEELTVNYNGENNDATPVWFESH